MRRNSRLISAIVILLAGCYYVSQYVSPILGGAIFIAVILVLGGIIMTGFSKETARKNGSLADSIEFYGDKIAFTMHDKRMINVKKADISRVIRYEDEFGYKFYLNDGTSIYYDFGQNLFTNKDITGLVNELNFPNARFETF